MVGEHSLSSARVLSQASPMGTASPANTLPGDHHLDVTFSVCMCHPCAPAYAHHDLTCYSPWLLAAKSSCQATGSPVSAEPAAAWGFAKVGAGVTSRGCWG